MKWVVRIGGGIVAVLVLALVVLVVMGLRENAGLSVSSVEINAPPERVWQWIEDPDKFKQWVSWTIEVQSLTPDVKGVGARTLVLMKEPGSPEPVRIESVCTQYAPPMRFSADVRFPGLFDGSQSYQLTGLTGGRTRIQIDTRIRYTAWLVRLLEPLATPQSTSKLDQDLATLKKLIEMSPTAAIDPR
jgi:uncharacterized protein YndB with AHSA1/START domain